MFRRNKNHSIRDAFWNYPETLVSAYNKTRPLGAILISVLVGVVLILQLSSPTVFSALSYETKNSWSEGVVGEVQVLNPIYVSQNQVDRDLFELIYEKFVNVDKYGNPVPGIAKKWVISDDSLTYTFEIDSDHNWSDGEKVTATDVAFTFQKAFSLAENGENTIASGLSDVTIVALDENTIEVKLPERNAALFESLSVYIVPEHILSEIEDVEYPTYGVEIIPIGSGPYRVESIRKNLVILKKSPTNDEDVRFDQLKYYTFTDAKSLEIAFRNGVFDGVSGLSGKEMGFLDEYDNYRVESQLLVQRKKLLFFNTREGKLANSELRRALAFSIDKDKILNDAEIDGEAVFNTLPSNSWAFNPNTNFYTLDFDQATSKIVGAGYVLDEESGEYEDKEGNPLTLTVTFLDNYINTRLATQFEKQWESFGITIELKPIDYNSLINEVLATRNFEILLFEIETTIEPDQYNLWHSLQKDYPNLNISGYEYNRVDIILERARLDKDKKSRTEDYFLFQKYLNQDVPVIFLYEPVYNYIVKEEVNGINLDEIKYPNERFDNIANWNL